MQMLLGPPGRPEVSAEQLRSSERVKLIRKLRWMGLEGEAGCVKKTALSRSAPAQSVPAAGIAVFDPDTVKIMSSALDDAWQRLNGSGAPLHGNVDPLARTLLAKHIVDIAKQGERDQTRLIQGALARFKL